MESLNPIDQIQLPVILAVMGVIVVTYFALRRVFFTPYVRVMETREIELEAAEAVLSEAEQISAAAAPEAQRIADQARQQAEELGRQLQERDGIYRRDAIDVAMRESSELLEKGRAEIAAARVEGSAALRDQAIECVSLACHKLIGEVRPDSVSAAVDKLLARRVV